jgi:hypothetical protein
MGVACGHVIFWSEELGARRDLGDLRAILRIV